MRAIRTNGPLSIQAIAGTYVVLLGIDMEKSRTKGVLGFGLHRTDHSENKTAWVEGFKSFKQANLPRGKLAPTNEQPIQAFLWGDYTVRKDHQYTYRIVAMRGKPGELHESDEVSVNVQMEKETKEGHYIF